MLIRNRKRIPSQLFYFIRDKINLGIPKVIPDSYRDSFEDRTFFSYNRLS